MGRVLARLRRLVGRKLLLALAVGLLLIAAVVLVAVDRTSATRRLADLLAAGIVLGAIIVGFLTLGGSTDADDERIAPPPWTEAGGIVDRAPERAVDDPDLAGDALAAEIDWAGRAARAQGTVADGLAELRPTLRSALVAVLVHDGLDPETAEERIDAGAWTDDAAAAATLSAEVKRPDWGLRERLRAWLFPERVVRREARRAVHEIGRAAADNLPAVPGQRAPRTVPVVRPGLAELRRGADGRLQRAVEPLVDPTGDAGVDGGDASSGGADTGERKPEEGPA